MAVSSGWSTTATYAGAGNNPNLTQTVGRTTTSGRTHVVGVVHESSSVAVSHTIGGVASGNTWRPIGSTIVGDPDATIYTHRVDWFYCDTFTGGANTVFSAVSSGGYASIFVMELLDTVLSGANGSLRGFTGRAVVGSPLTSGQLAVSETGGLAVGFFSTNGTSAATFTANNGFSTQVQQTDGASVWTGALTALPVSATGDYEASLSTTVSPVEGVAVIAYFGGAVAATSSNANVTMAYTPITMSATAGVRASASVTMAYAPTTMSASASTVVGSESNASVSMAYAPTTMSATAGVRASASVSMLYAPTTMSASASTAVGQHPLAYSMLALENQEGYANASTPAITTPAFGAAITLRAGFTVNNEAPVDTYANTWTGAGRAVYAPPSYNGAYDIEAYVASPAFGGAGHQVTWARAAEPSGEGTYPFIFVPSGRVVDTDLTYRTALASSYTSGTVTLTKPGVIIAVWAGDQYGLVHTADASSPYVSILENMNLRPKSEVQMKVVYREAAAGDHSVTWSNVSPLQGAPLYLFAVEFVSSDIATNMSYAPTTMSATASTAAGTSNATTNMAYAPTTMSATAGVRASASVTMAYAPTTMSATAGVRASAAVVMAYAPTTMSATAGVQASAYATMAYAPTTMSATAGILASASVTMAYAPTTMNASASTVAGTANVAVNMAYAPTTMSATAGILASASVTMAYAPTTMSASAAALVSISANMSYAPMTMTIVASTVAGSTLNINKRIVFGERIRSIAFK